jgi:DNA-binding transcriptional LysR family regulator
MHSALLQSLTLDQLLLFVTVAETGSFSAAARRLDRVQSTISHGIGQLERQLGLPLFDRRTRKPGLTRAGQHLLQQAQQILSQVHHLHSEAQILQAGYEPSVSLVIDMIIPVEILTRSLKAVQQTYPKVRWLLHTEMLSAITQRVLDGSSQLGLTGQLLPQHRSKLEISPLGQVDFVFVAAPSHPLAQALRSLNAAHLAQYTHLAVVDRGDADYPEGDRWYLADLQTLLHFVKEGFGWAFLPLHLVKPALQAGALCQLRLEDRRRFQPFTVYSIRLKSEPNGPVREALLAALKQAFADSPQAAL